MAWNTWLCDTRTGQNRIRVPASTFGWGRALNAVAGGSSAFLLREPKTAAVINQGSTTPLAKTLVLDWDGFVTYAGPIWSRAYERNTGILTMEHRDIWSMFAKRLVVTTNTAGVEKTTLRIPAVGEPAVSKATLAKGIVFEGTDAASSMYDLPITYPADVLGSDFRTYPGYTMPTVQDALQELMDSDGGPDVDFQPEWNSNGDLRWVMRAGSLSGSTVSWNVTAPKPGALDVTWADDANKVANNVLAIGQGSEADMLVGAARDTGSPYPAVETVLSYKNETSKDRLDALAAEYLRVYGAPTNQWGASILAGGTPGVADLKIGGTARLYFKGDPWIPNGYHSNRIIEFSGDLTDKVKLGFQPTGGA